LYPCANPAVGDVSTFLRKFNPRSTSIPQFTPTSTIPPYSYQPVANLHLQHICRISASADRGVPPSAYGAPQRAFSLRANRVSPNTHFITGDLKPRNSTKQTFNQNLAAEFLLNTCQATDSNTQLAAPMSNAFHVGVKPSSYSPDSPVDNDVVLDGFILLQSTLTRKLHIVRNTKGLLKDYMIWPNSNDKICFVGGGSIHGRHCRSFW
jgi:hypothetical protein